MQKIRLKNGWYAYEVGAAEIVSMGGYGICDECGHTALRGYLVPVLNHWMCPQCFEEWKGQAKYYPEDEPFERRNMEYYESILPMSAEWSEMKHKEKE